MFCGKSIQGWSFTPFNFNTICLVLNNLAPNSKLLCVPVLFPSFHKSWGQHFAKCRARKEQESAIL